MKVLVTGAGGYIGSILVPMLLEEDFQVIALDRFHFGKDKLPRPSENLSLLEDDIRFVKKETLQKFGHIDAVIDLAALSNDPVGELDPMKTYSINHLGRLRIATLAKYLGVERYVLPSSCSIYGFQDHIVNEESEINPLTAYAIANLNAEQDIFNLADDNFCVTVLRQATVYGLAKRMRFDLAINGMTKGFFLNKKIPILRDGNQWRPFVHVYDTSLAQLLTIKADKDKVNKQIFNVGSNDQNYSIFKLAELVAGGIGIDFAYEWYGEPDHRSYQVNFDKITKTLGFKPTFDAAKGAKEVWDALVSKQVDPNDPQTITLKWYQKLISENVMI